MGHKSIHYDRYGKTTYDLTYCDLRTVYHPSLHPFAIIYLTLLRVSRVPPKTSARKLVSAPLRFWLKMAKILFFRGPSSCTYIHSSQDDCMSLILHFVLDDAWQLILAGMFATVPVPSMP